MKSNENIAILNPKIYWMTSSGMYAPISVNSISDWNWLIISHIPADGDARIADEVKQADKATIVIPYIEVCSALVSDVIGSKGAYVHS